MRVSFHRLIIITVHLNVPGKEAALETPGFSKMDFNSDQRFAPQQNISSRMNIMTDFFGLGASKVPSFPRTLMFCGVYAANEMAFAH